jgi:NADH dehydrogenase (ubiquinone) Fe-S protein 1
VASRPAAYDVGFVPSARASKTKPKFVYLLNADEVDPKSIPQDAFVVYQGHHGDLGAQLADVCLPAAAYTEKGTTWINTEGRAQMGRAAVPPPGAAREDWKIVRSVLFFQRFFFLFCYEHLINLSFLFSVPCQK